MKSIPIQKTSEITPELIKSVGFQVGIPTARYCSGSTDLPLKQSSEVPLVFEDEHGMWSIEGHGIVLSVRGKLDNPDKLFVHDGVAQLGDCLGLALRLTSSPSRQRLISKSNCEIIDSSDTLEFDCELKVLPGVLRQSATLELLLYYCRDSDYIDAGTVIGVLGSWSISFINEGIEFPFTTVESDDNFLWRLEFDCEDPKHEKFSECTRIVVNRKHAYYSQLDLDNKPLNSGLFVDIVCNATVLLIQKMRESKSFDDVVKGNDLDPGSVGWAVHDILMTYDDCYDDPSSLLEGLQKNIYDLLKVN